MLATVYSEYYHTLIVDLVETSRDITEYLQELGSVNLKFLEQLHPSLAGKIAELNRYQHVFKAVQSFLSTYRTGPPFFIR